MTNDYLRDVAQVLGSLQRGFLPKHPRLWEHGLEVTMRGISTQAFKLQGEDTTALLDLVKHKVRLGDTNWQLDAYTAPELFNNVKAWLEARGVQVKLEVPEFSKPSSYDREQAGKYAEALWWVNRQFRDIVVELHEGIVSPILLYPHHFDLAFSWFPFDDDTQFTLGWSTGDEHIPEAYIYLTLYPETKGFTDLKLPDEAYWQKDGFNGAILPYAALRSSDEPVELLQNFAGNLLAGRRKLPS